MTLGRIEGVDAAIARLEAALAEKPDSPVLAASLASWRKRRSRLQTELDPTLDGSPASRAWAEPVGSASATREGRAHRASR